MIINNQINGNIINERIIEIPYTLIQISKFQNTSSKILDFGNVESLISLQLASLGYDVTGIDLRIYDFKHKNLTQIQNNILNTKINNNFDIIISLSQLEHVGLQQYGNHNIDFDEDKKIIDKFYQILNKNGVLILTIPFSKEFKILSWYRLYNFEKINNLIQNKFKFLDISIFKKKQQQWNKINLINVIDYEPINDEIQEVGCFTLQKVGD